MSLYSKCVSIFVFKTSARKRNMGSGQSSAVDTSDYKIVVVGGGYGGSFLSYKLVTEHVGKVTMINPRDGMFHSIGALRAAVDASYHPKLFIPYDKLSDAYLQGQVVALDAKNKTLTLESGSTVSYTHLVIATGTSSSFPAKLGLDNPNTTKEAAFEKYTEYRKEIVAAKRVVLVGGGAVGVEMAGEIKTDFPDKTVTIVNSHDYFVTKRGKPGFHKKLRQALKEKRIDVMLNERVSNLNELTLNKNVDGQVVKMDSGKEIECDLVIPCIGTRINNQFFKDELADSVDESGALCVNEFLQVKGHENIYAIGDINDVEEEKMAATARYQALALVKTLKGKPTSYKPTPGDFAMVVPLGRTGGVGQFKGMILGDFMVKKFKSEDMFAKMMFNDLGVQVPK